METEKSKLEDGFFDGRWLRKATVWEKYWEIFMRNGRRSVWIQLDLKSKEPLQQEDVRAALNNLYRKCPSLSVCFGIRNGETWVRRATNPEIDFEVIHGHNIVEVRNFLGNFHYKTFTGPLFCARLLFNPPDGAVDEDDMDPDLHNVSYMFLGIPHAFTDGYTDHCITKYFITLLNDVISNKEIGEECLGVLLLGERLYEALPEKRISCGNSGQQPNISEKKGPLALASYILDRSADLKPDEYTKQNDLIKVFDCKTTSKMIEVRRKENVSFNSLVMALVNVAIVDLLSEDGIILDSYGIKTRYLLDIRRFWKVKEPEGLGLHICKRPIHMETPKNAFSKFWDYARSVQQEVRKDIYAERLIEEEYEFRYPSSDRIWDEEGLLRAQPLTEDYKSSCHGDVTTTVTEGGEHVRITHTTPVIMQIPNNELMLVQTHIYRGKFYLIIIYREMDIKQGTIERIFDNVVQKLKDLLSN